LLGFGCAQIASLTTRHPRVEIEAVLLEGFDRGINFFDTADIYGQGDSERLLGKLFGTRRSQVIFCSKAGLVLGWPQLGVRYAKPVLAPLLRRWSRPRDSVLNVRRKSQRQCFEPGYIQAQIEGSLRRLRTDYLDIFLLHEPPAEVIARGDTFVLLDQLRRRGAIRAYGVSCASPADAMLSLEQPGVSCLQVAVNRTSLADMEEVLQRAHASGKAIIARECFAGGSLLRQDGQSRADPVGEALGALRARPEIGVILIGMGSRQHLRQNQAALR
jgi:aryl-alcohol dehydrogenase-like predicted oxidoreductase